MKPSTILLLMLITFSNACSGQKNKPAIGKEVSQLSPHLWYVYQDKKSNYWFGSNGQGLYCYNGKTIVNYTTKDGLCNDSIRQIQEDNLGNIYCATLGGINKFDGQKITTLKAIKSNDWKLEPGDLWFSILGKKNENGPYRYDGKNLYNLAFPKHYSHDTLYRNGINPFFSPYEVYCIYKDRQGAMWFGTSVLGACRYDGKTIKWLYEKDLTIAPNGGSFGIRSFYQDKNNCFWICNTQQRFLFDFKHSDTSNNLHYQKTKGIGDASVFEGDERIYFSHIIEDNDGVIWLTTWSQGVWKYDGKNIKHYKVIKDNKSVNLVSMYKDKNGSLWLGTANNGVYKFNGTSFESFSP